MYHHDKVIVTSNTQQDQTDEKETEFQKGEYPQLNNTKPSSNQGLQLPLSITTWH